MEFTKDEIIRNYGQNEEATPRNIDQMVHRSNNTPSGSPTFLKKWWKYILVSLSILIFVVIIIVVLICSNKKDKYPNKTQEKEENINQDIDMEEAKKVFSSIFNISSKENTLTQLSQKSLQSYESTLNGEKASFNVLNKAIYDIYTLNSTPASDEYKNFYRTKYFSVITVNSLCSKSYSKNENDDCQLEKLLDLNKREENNLRRNDEENTEELIQKAILPICIVEHTDTNIIISITCPETLSDNFKEDIIRAFNIIKPDSQKGFDFDKNYVDTTIQEKDDKIYIYSFDNVCMEPNEDPTKIITCNLTKDIITDKEGNLILSKSINLTKTIKDENNSFSSNFTYEFKNIQKEKSEGFDQDIYKVNLDSIFSITKSLMKKEFFIENFTDYVIDLMKNDEEKVNETIIIRNLNEENDINPGVKEENVFNKNLFNITMKLNLKNDIGLGKGQSAKAISIHDVNNDNYTELARNQLETKLNETMNKFISLTKSGNKLANDLYEEINELLLKLRDIINENIEEINNFLAHEDLSTIFDSTNAIKDLKVLTYDFIPATENLYNSMKDLGDNLLYNIDKAKNKFKEDISSFLIASHNLIYKIFNSLVEASDALSSDKTKIVSISSYYLNDTDNSYYKLIQNAKDVLDNYYENEKNLILPLVNHLIDNFYEKTQELATKNQSNLDELSDRLSSGDTTILLANSEDYKKCINNIYNTKIKVNQIIETIKNQFEKSINLQSNGYFENQKELDDNNQSYSQISEKAISIAYALDNNEFIDKAFDNVMISFRDEFINLLKYMDNSLKEKFPLEENVLSSSLFNNEYLDEVDEFFKTEKVNILNFIKIENNNYLKSVNEYLKSFEDNSGNSLDQIMNKLVKSEFTDINLDNLNKVFWETLQIVFANINQIIQNNNYFGIQYFESVRKANSYHITIGFINKYSTFIYSIQSIENFVVKDLRNNLANRYKNVINQLRALLQKIKSNNVLEKYIKQIPLAESHLNYLKELYAVLNRHITDNYFNTVFLPFINNFIGTTYSELNKIKANFANYYNIMAQKEFKNTGYDYDLKKKVKDGDRYCCRKVRRHCKKHCYYPDTYDYFDYNVIETNNHLKLIYLNFDVYITIFDNQYNLLYQQFSNSISSYNSLLSNLDSVIESKKNEFKKNDLKNLNVITEKIKSIIDTKLGNTLLIESYNYFKNKIIKILPKELDDILTQWKNAYDKVYDDIDSNKNNFKSSIKEFANLATFYISTYTQNISYDFGNSVTEKEKNDFNYTIQYYYNLILSKVNKTYSYILNNMPINEKPFDDILDLRINEIKKSLNDNINEIKNSKNSIFNKIKQETILQVNPNNFFYSNDIISEHIKTFNLAMKEKVANLYTKIEEISNDNNLELIAAKYYLENSINGKQIKENYDAINKATFVDLQTDVYQSLIDSSIKIEPEELIQNLLKSLKNLNENNNKTFNYQLEEYINLIKLKLYEEFKITEEGLNGEINSLYTNGINNFNVNNKQSINNILDNILNKITTHLSNEESRLIYTLTSYTNDFSKIITRLNNYKASINNQFCSAIKYVVDEFYLQVSEKFYKNFIDKGLNQYESNLKNQSFEIAQFLNMSINLDERIGKESNSIISGYRNTTLNRIDFFYQKKINDLNDIFSFDNIKSKINNHIDNLYNSKLLPALKDKAKSNPGGEGVSEYDLSEDIIKDIDGYISIQLQKVKEIMSQMKGKNFTLNDAVPADFSNGKDSVYKKISDKFHNFSIINIAKEKEEFEKIIKNNALNNFKNLLDNFIPSFGVDFFDRILKYNEIQKIKRLFHNIQYSLAETIIYYISLSSTYNNIQLPQDIKLKLFLLNNLDSVVNSKNNFIISSLNSKLDGYFEETKNYIIQKYLDEMNTNTDFNLKFNSNLKTIIIGTICGNVSNYENEYITRMKNNIKNPFIKEYTSVLNLSTEEMKHFIELSKIEMKVELDKIFALDSNSILADIQTKLDKASSSVEEYKTHFNNFKISQEVIDFLDKFGEEMITPKYKEIKDLLDEKAVNLTINNLESLSDQFKNEYSIEKFREKVKEAQKNFTNNINKLNKSINNYGSIKDVYKKNLEKEIANYDNRQIMNYRKFDKTFNEIRDSSLSLKDFILSLNLFTNFEENTDKFINEKNQQYLSSKYVLDKNQNKNDFYDLMIKRLEELKDISLDYYNQSKDIFDIMKEQIIDNIIDLNELLKSCEEITSETIKNAYIDIKDKFNKVEESQNLEKEKIKIEPYKNKQSDIFFITETTVENYVIDNKFILDLLYDEETKSYNVIGKVVNNIKPRKFNINFYSPIGQNEKSGRKIDVNFNKISSYTNITFNSELNKATIITNFDFDEYSVKTQYYEEKIKQETKQILGITIVIDSIIYNNTETPDNEKYYEVPSKNITLINDYYY